MNSFYPGLRGALRASCSTLLAAALCLGAPAWAQDEPDAPGASESTDSRQRPPRVGGARTVTIDFVKTDIKDLVKFFAEITGRNFIIDDDLKGEITIISHRPVSVDAAYQAFLSSLEVMGYTTVTNGSITKIIATSAAGQAPLSVRTGGDAIPYTDQFVTQLITLENASVSDISGLVTSLASANAKVITYAPSNTLILTDAGFNVRKIFKIINELDVAAPKSKLHYFQLQFADAAEVQSIIEQLYGTQDTSSASTSASRATSARERRRNRRNRAEQPTTASSVSAGEKSKYIEKVLSDERTNSLIVLANNEAVAAVRDLIGELDVDVSNSSRTQIHVIYLEHAKAEDVAQVIQGLSQGGGNTNSQSSRNNRNNRNTNQNNRRAGNADTRAQNASGSLEQRGGAAAVFDSGMRIAHDENTNSLVIVASPEDYRVIRAMIEKLDVKRRQVFIDAVVLELTSEDTFELGLAYHGPYSPTQGAAGLIGGQFGATSLGLSQDLLSGLALGVFGESVSVAFADGTAVNVPAFGIVLNAIKSNSSVNIVSNPNLLTLDNEEAKIVVGRQVPFPQTSALSNLGQPVVSYQREDVAITLQVTPRVNSSNYVTLEVVLEVAEIEEDDQGLDINQSGLITSKRELESVALVRDNQTVVMGGLVGTTSTEVETKVPVLGDIPVIGGLFRGSRRVSRKTNLMIFLTPHVIDDEEDMYEIMRVKEAQRQEFLRRFYGKSRDEQMSEIRRLLQYSMNNVDQPSLFRGPTAIRDDVELDGEPISEAARAAAQAELERARGRDPGAGAGELPEDAEILVDFGDEESELAVPIDESTEPAPTEGE